jgi:hypothetical protein
MAPTKSSRPRQIEEESDAEVSNLPKGPGHEDGTSNQGSGDAEAPNLPIVGPDHEDEDGDNECHSPSIYLSLNQDENVEDATNAEHEGNENEEDEGKAEQDLVGSLSASQVRRAHGPNKLPSRHFVIIEVNEVGDTMQPPISVNVPVMYIFWKGKKLKEEYIVPDSIK